MKLSRRTQVYAPENYTWNITRLMTPILESILYTHITHDKNNTD